ncbi:restriction endonuclease subunit S [Streptomyces sp. SS1-1]|uniref:restriction endonuclease subunit S n=1 Tax=Streptomyces sp. SS1-1 TaxID=2651869 RepID=UPI001CEF665C|nr:restriction endonuclease subunit S [Streptomyces sp. SS1-1]
MSSVLNVTIPDSWSSAPLKRVTSALNRGSAPDYVDAGPVRVISQASNQASGLDWWRTRFHDFNGNPKSLKGYLYPSDVLINSTGTGTLGRVGYFTGSPDGLPCMADSHVTIARAKRDELDARFSYYWLGSKPFQEYIYAALVVGATNQIELNRDRLGDAPVPLPPLDEQRSIADFLDAETARIDHLISKFDKQRTLVSERERAALPLSVGGALLGDGHIETGLPWFAMAHPESRLVPLIRVLHLQRGVDLSDKQRRPGSVPVFTTAGPSGSHDTAIAGAPGVVIGRYGSVGNVHWAETPYWPHNTTLYVKNFGGNDERYCYHLLRALPYDMEQARAAVPGVNRNDLHKQLVPLVPRNLQKRTSQQADELASWRHATNSRIERAQILLKERRKALITAAVTGQFDVSTASGRNVTEGVTV